MSLTPLFSPDLEIFDERFLAEIVQHDVFRLDT
jgi:hypothetical protein